MKWVLISFKDTDLYISFHYDQRTVTTIAYLISMPVLIFRKAVEKYLFAFDPKQGNLNISELVIKGETDLKKHMQNINFLV